MIKKTLHLTFNLSHAVAWTFFAVTALLMLPFAARGLFFDYHKDDVYMVAHMDGGETVGHGSGFAVETPDGKRYVLTNAHVCDHPEYDMVLIDYNGEKYSTEVVKMDKARDLCAVKYVGNAEPFELTSKIYPRLPLFAIGYPSHNPMTMTSGQFIGIINTPLTIDADKEECLYELDGSWVPRAINMGGFFVPSYGCKIHKKFYATDIEVRPGSSGGPMVNVFGGVSGMTTSVDEGFWAFAIPGLDIIKFVEEIKE